jgi:hypothetical protein
MGSGPRFRGMSWQGARKTIDAFFASAVEVGVGRIEVLLPSLDKFMPEHLAATPIAAQFAAADPAARKKVGEHVKRRLQHYAESDGVTYPEETYVVTARAQ